MKPRLAAGCAAMLAASACRNTPEPFATPVQRQTIPDFRIVNMADEDAATHFVSDITTFETATWRWTGKKPTVRLRMRDVENLRYTIDFAVAEETLQATGPLTVSFLVNDRVLDRVRYANAGSHHFEKPVPEGWVIAGQDVTVGAEVDKLWASPQYSTKLGIILVRIGLTQ